MKGILIYKEETTEMWRLIEKYPVEVVNLNVTFR